LKLPNSEQAIIEESKLVGYLLNLSHPDGWSKAKFFFELGFNRNNPQRLEEALKQHASQTNILSIQETPFGLKYVLEGNLVSIFGKPYKVRTIWFIGYNESIPKLVTAYPVN